MARMKMMRRRTYHMSSKTHSLVSTGRSQAEEGDDVNSNTSGNNNQTPPVRSSFEMLNPILCEACGQRFNVREEVFTHLKTHMNITQHISELHSSIDESPTGPLFVPESKPESESEPRGPNGLVTRQLLELINDSQSNDDDSSRNNRRKKKKTPTPDLTLRVGLKARRGRPRSRPLPPGPSYGPNRRFLWFKEFATNLQLAGNNVGFMLGDTGNVDQISSLFQTLSDEQLELKLGI